MAERTLLTNARILTCSGDIDERPFDGDVLIEGNKIAKVVPARHMLDVAAVTRTFLESGYTSSSARERRSRSTTCSPRRRWTAV